MSPRWEGDDGDNCSLHVLGRKTEKTGSPLHRLLARIRITFLLVACSLALLAYCHQISHDRMKLIKARCGVSFRFSRRRVRSTSRL